MIAARDLAPGFMVRHLVKDLRLVLATPPGHGFEELRGTDSPQVNPYLSPISLQRGAQGGALVEQR